MHVSVWQTSGQPICRPTKPGLTCYSWERIHVSKWTKYGCESRRVWQAAAGPDDSVAFPTFPSVDNFNPPRHRVEEHEAYCTEKNTAVHTGSAWQWCHKHWIPLNVCTGMCTLQQCDIAVICSAVATWTLWTLCTLFGGDSNDSRDTLDTAVDNGLQCESRLFCALAKIIPEIYIPTPTEDWSPLLWTSGKSSHSYAVEWSTEFLLQKKCIHIFYWEVGEPDWYFTRYERRS